VGISPFSHLVPTVTDEPSQEPIRMSEFSFVKGQVISLIVDFKRLINQLQEFSFPLPTPQSLECEQSRICSKIRGDEHKTSERASVTASSDRSLVLRYSLRSSPWIFEQKRDRSQCTQSLRQLTEFQVFELCLISKSLM